MDVVIGLLLTLLAACAIQPDSHRSAARSDSLLPIAGTHLFVHQEGSGDAIVVVHGGPVLDHGYLREPLRELARDHRQFGRIMVDLTTYDLLDDLEPVSVPTLIVFGSDEAGVGRVAEQLRSTLPDASIARIPDAGHFAFIEQPVAFHDAVRSFLVRAAEAADCDVVVNGLEHLIRSTEPIDATFVLLNHATGCTTRFAPDRARTRFLPASTFKIPNSLIALETGVADGAGFALRWDSIAAPTTRASWARDHTLESAFRNSVYWFYQELARRIGSSRMHQWLARFDYGNRSMGGGIDGFWLHGDLRISPDEQVRFLRRLHQGDLPVSERSREIVRQLMLLEETDGYRLYGKTGTSDVTPTRENGWLVGFVETDDDVNFYALNMEGETVWEDWPPQTRIELVRSILRELKVLPASR